MFGFFERQRLVRKGFAASKQRRRRTESELVQTLEYGPWAKAGVCVAFLAALLVMIQAEGQAKPLENALIAVLIFLTALTQLWINHPKTFDRNSRLALLFGVFLLHLGIVKLLLLTAETSAPATAQQMWRLAVPYALAPLLMSVLLGRNHGIFAAIYVSLWGAIIHREIDAKFLVMSLISGFIAVFVTLQVRRRSRLIRAGVFVGLATCVLAILFSMIPILDLPDRKSTRLNSSHG